MDQKEILNFCLERGILLDKEVLALLSEATDFESARLMIRIWDGGEGTFTEHFKINGHPYSITSGRANHDLVFTNVEVDVKHLKPGANTLTLLSDTEHHGIEVLLPGPCLLLRYGKSVQLPFD